jgi:WD40 repeat protein
VPVYVLLFIEYLITPAFFRREQISCAFSPCLKYIGVGSEDRQARIYDLVAGKEAVKLGLHKDVVTSVEFNPMISQLVTSSVDGSVRFYSGDEM